jgi:hypothetical protein
LKSDGSVARKSALSKSESEDDENPYDKNLKKGD